MNNENKHYREALDWIHGLSRFGTKPGLERITVLLDYLGNPHRKVNFVHIAGTNGKGSTAAMLASIMRAAGYRTGLYTSPYLLSFSNRMAVDGDDISPEELADLVDEVRPLVEQISADDRYGHPTEFEVVTVLALTYFARRGVDLVVLEVGLGGRLDATNVVTPLLSVITNVSLEHTEVLGDTVEEVAFEKAGIIKQEVPVLTASDDHKVLAVIKAKASELAAPLYSLFTPCANSEKKISRPVFNRRLIIDHGQIFDYNGFKHSYQDLFIPLRGRYQICNAATALAAVELLENKGIMVDEQQIRQGLTEVLWPGRLELLENSPKLVMDGAHNPAAIRQMAEAVPEYFDYHCMILVFGIMADKDAPAMMSAILPLADRIIFTRATISRAADPALLYKTALEQLYCEREKAMVIEDIGTALGEALSDAGPEDLVLVTGSFYTVSDARAYWKQNI
ncbi:MAG: folylpolyglutamate synthase/dihydrofolate synthase family protein [Bacillota bacterium]